MKVNKWIKICGGVAGIVTGIACFHFLKEAKEGKDYVPEGTVLDGIEKSRSVDDKLVIENYEASRNEFDTLVDKENKKVEKLFAEEKEKMGYQDKLSEIKSRAKSFRNEFKKEIDYEGKKKQLKRDLDEAVKNQKTEAKIDFRLAEQEAIKTKAEKEYSERSLKLALASLGEKDDELYKEIETKIKDDHTKAIKGANEEIEKINKELSDIKKTNRENYEKALSDLDSCVAEGCKAVEENAEKQINALHKSLNERYDELVKEVKSKRNKTDAKTVSDYEQACERYEALIEAEKQKALTRIKDLTETDRIALYLIDNGWDSGTVNAITYTTAGAVVIVVAKVLYDFVKMGRSISKVMKSYGA